MGKITVVLSDDVEKELRKHVTAKYPERPYGKLSEVVEEALREWLKRH
ncbi:ribbon-helix-helix domain-containing protein [Candidatus Bathyarchaeota archaeon]|nr:ribbon-helix-helix domain-containing protein [Candidatus Bathyarchaeota archaeon]